MPFDQEILLEDDEVKNTKEIIIETILLYKKITPHQIKQKKGISLSMIHRELRYLCGQKVIEKVRKPPYVHYELSTVNYEHMKNASA